MNVLRQALARYFVPCPEPITHEQSEALASFALKHGRTWKSKLRLQWYIAASGPILHGLRNTHGPEWLIKFKLPKV